MLKESAAHRPGARSAVRPQSSVVGVSVGTFTDLVGYRDGVLVTSIAKLTSNG